jgi:predicted DNA-binding transcriptional regulator YafY
MNEMIKSAIENKKVIEFYYKDDLRIVEPFVLGISTTGKESLRGFQVAGDSTDSSNFSWKLFTVAKISNLRVKDENFIGNREYYNPDDSAFSQIFARV